MQYFNKLISTFTTSLPPPTIRRSSYSTISTSTYIYVEYATKCLLCCLQQREPNCRIQTRDRNQEAKSEIGLWQAPPINTNDGMPRRGDHRRRQNTVVEQVHAGRESNTYRYHTVVQGKNERSNLPLSAALHITITCNVVHTYYYRCCQPYVGGDGQLTWMLSICSHAHTHADTQEHSALNALCYVTVAFDS